MYRLLLVTSVLVLCVTTEEVEDNIAMETVSSDDTIDISSDRFISSLEEVFSDTEFGNKIPRVIHTATDIERYGSEKDCNRSKSKNTLYPKNVTMYQGDKENYLQMWRWIKWSKLVLDIFVHLSILEQ